MRAPRGSSFEPLVAEERGPVRSPYVGQRRLAGVHRQPTQVHPVGGSPCAVSASRSRSSRRCSSPQRPPMPSRPPAIVPGPRRRQAGARREDAAASAARAPPSSRTGTPTAARDRPPRPALATRPGGVLSRAARAGTRRAIGEAERDRLLEAAAAAARVRPLPAASVAEQPQRLGVQPLLDPRQRLARRAASSPRRAARPRAPGSPRASGDRRQGDEHLEDRPPDPVAEVARQRLAQPCRRR